MRRSFSAVTILSVGADIFLADRVALDTRPIGEERARPLRLGGVERFLRVRENFLNAARHGAAPRRRRSSTVTETGPPWSSPHRRAPPASKRSAATRISSGEQLLQHDAELVSGEAAEQSSAAHLGAHALGHRADHLVGDVVAIGLVDAREIVDRDQQEPAGLPRADRLLERVGQNARVRCQRLISPVSPSNRDR